MRKFIVFLVITVVVIFAGDSYAEIASRPLLPLAILSIATIIMIVIAVAYGYYVIKLLQEVLNINQQSKKEEEQ